VSIAVHIAMLGNRMRIQTVFYTPRKVLIRVTQAIEGREACVRMETDKTIWMI
jgi:hypothetical protein